jgi:hypothetical protein
MGLICCSVEIVAQSRSNAEGSERPSTNPFDVGSTVGGSALRHYWPTTAKELDRLNAQYETSPLGMNKLYSSLYWASEMPFVGPRGMTFFVFALTASLSMPISGLNGSQAPGFIGLVLGALPWAVFPLHLELRKDYGSLGARAEAFFRFNSLHGDRAASNVSKADRQAALEKAAEVNAACVKSHRILAAGGVAFVTSGVLTIEGVARSFPIYENARAQFIKRLREKAGWL